MPPKTKPRRGPGRRRRAGRPPIGARPLTRKQIQARYRRKLRERTATAAEALVAADARLTAALARRRKLRDDAAWEKIEAAQAELTAAIQQAASLVRLLMTVRA